MVIPRVSAMHGPHLVQEGGDLALSQGAELALVLVVQRLQCVPLLGAQVEAVGVAHELPSADGIGERSLRALRRRDRCERQ